MEFPICLILLSHLGKIMVLSTFTFVLSMISFFTTDASVSIGNADRVTNTYYDSNPASVTIAGDLQSELGCTGDWQPDCVATELVYAVSDDVWRNDFTIPAGSWNYKVPLNGSWVENYGLHAQLNGSNIPVSLGQSSSVKFYYDHKTHWATDNVNSRIVTAPGSYQSEIGCPGDWDPACLRSWLQDPDGDGIFIMMTSAIPVGFYEIKVAIDEGWDENYGADGVFNGPNIGFSVNHSGSTVLFSFKSSDNLLKVTVIDQLAGPLVICPSLANIEYSLPEIPFTDTYQWHFTDGSAAIASNGASLVSVNFNHLFNGGNLSVMAFNGINSMFEETISIQKGNTTFCELTSCQSTNPNLSITDAVIAQPGALDVYKAINDLEIDVNINALRTIVVKAGNQITLQPNFNLQLGATFVAQIETCVVSTN